MAELSKSPPADRANDSTTVPRKRICAGLCSMIWDHRVWSYSRTRSSLAPGVPTMGLAGAASVAGALASMEAMDTDGAAASDGAVSVATTLLCGDGRGFGFIW